MRLFIYVEGQEEEMFVNRVLRHYLAPFGVAVQKPVLAATSFRQESAEAEPDVTVGGVTNYASIQADILSLFEQGNIGAADFLTSFIDLYALPNDFPGHKEAVSQGLAGARKASFIETAWKNDIARANFIPHIQPHEFEALILTRPSALAVLYPEKAANIESLRLECAPYASPEDINESKETSPSHRILSHLPEYTKIDGFRHLQEIGLKELKVHCPHFKAWIERCEQSFRS